MSEELIEAIKNGDVEVIMKELSTLHDVRDVHLASCKLGDITYLSWAFNRVKFSWMILDLSFNGIIDISSLSTVLTFNPSLTSLFLGKNKIKDISGLSQALTHNHTLENLDLWGNKINDISGIANMLKENTTLRTIMLGKNKITDISEISEALKVNQSLITLSLWGNRISDISSAIEMFKYNKTLISFDLSANFVNVDHRQQLYVLLERNHHNNVRRTRTLNRTCWKNIRRDASVVQTLPPIIVSLMKG